METTTIKKLDLKPVKDFIKQEEAKQKALKNARKTAIFGEVNGKIVWTPMHPSEAQSDVHHQGIELRKMYAAYALLRGKKLSDVEKNYREDDAEHFLNQHVNMFLIKRMLEKFEKLSEIKTE